MNAAQFSEAIKALGLSQLAAARFLGVGPRTVRRWVAADADVPKHVSMLLRLMVRDSIAPDTIDEALAEAEG
jgi:DNA-binding transcriptional regulator YiaG